MKILWLFLIISSAIFSFNLHSDEHKKGHSTECRPSIQTSYNSNGCHNNEKNKSPIPKSIACNVGGYNNNCFEKKNFNQKPVRNIEKATDFIGIESYRTAKEDLLAQQSMDEAATEMVSISKNTYYLLIVSVFFSGIGIILIWQTLVATKDAISEAQVANSTASEALTATSRSNSLQLQPWLHIGEPKVSLRVKFSPSQPLKSTLCNIEVPITNEGKTPVNWFTVDLSKAIVKIHIPEYGRATFTASASEPSGQFIHINSETTHISTNLIVMSFCPANSEDNLLPDGECWFDLEFQVRFKDLFTADDNHRCLDVKSIRKYDRSEDKTIVKINVGRETLCSDEGRFGLIHDNRKSDKV